MKEIKSFFTNDMPVIPKAPKKKQLQRLPLQVGIDYCNRFRPLFDKQTFRSQFKDTNGEIIEYFDESTRKDYQSFLSASRYISIGSVVLSLGVAMFCHKVGIIRRMLGEKSWKMFTFKSIFLVAPYYVVEQVLLPEAENQELELLYTKVKNRYRRFKLNGDITELNHKIQLTDAPLQETQKLHFVKTVKQTL